MSPQQEANPSGRARTWQWPGSASLSAGSTGPMLHGAGVLTPSGEAAGCGTLSFAQSNARCQTAAGYCVGPPAGGLGEQNLGPRPSLPRLASEQCVPRVIRGKQSSVGTGPCFQIMPRASAQLCLQLCLGLVKVGRLVCG